jgi:hypothetical protein
MKRFLVVLLSTAALLGCNQKSTIRSTSMAPQKVVRTASVASETPTPITETTEFKTKLAFVLAKAPAHSKAEQICNDVRRYQVATEIGSKLDRELYLGPLSNPLATNPVYLAYYKAPQDKLRSSITDLGTTLGRDLPMVIRNSSLRKKCSDLPSAQAALTLLEDVEGGDVAAGSTTLEGDSWRELRQIARKS